MNSCISVFLIVVLIGVALINGCAERPEKVKQMTPKATPVTTPTTPKIALKLEKIEPTKKKEKVPERYFPPMLPWKLFKGKEEGDMYYSSFIPRKPIVGFTVNVSVHLGYFVSTPLIEGDKVFLADGGGVYALNRKTGEFLWGREILSDSLEGRKISYPQPWERWVALGTGKNVASYAVGKYLFVGTSGGGKNLLMAFDKNAGDVVWKATLQGENDNFVTSNLLVADGIVCAGTIHSDSRVYCFSEDGKFLWSTKLEGTIRGLAYGDGMLFATSESGKKLFALDASTGMIKWVYEHDNGVNTPVYPGEIIFTDSVGNVVALSKEGKLLWKKNIGAGSDVNSNSLLAVSKNRIYAARTLGERPLQLYVLDLDGNVIGNFSMGENEYPGIPMTTNDVVVLPVKGDRYSKIYFLWKGTAKLHEIKILESDEAWMPRLAASYGEIYVTVRVPDLIYRLMDKVKPVISGVETELLDSSMKIKVMVQDEQSAIYKAILVYSINGSDWKYNEMQISRRYITEPIGGYGLNEEPYEATIPIKPGSKIEYYIIAIDNVGNYDTSDTYAYRVSVSSG